MAVFIAGNTPCPKATGYGALMAAWVVTALAHRACFGIGRVVASPILSYRLDDPAMQPPVPPLSTRVTAA